ncbi:chemotaxis protein CheW [bacterium]|nr:chemotaxis protein CheW [bacterium]
MNARDEDSKFEVILLHRAEMAAQVPKREVEESELVRVIVFNIGDEKFGVRIENLIHIVPCPHITTLPQMPRIISGIAHIRDDIIAICSLADWFHIQAKTLTYLAVVEGSRGKVGLIFDQISGFQNVRNDDIARSFCASSSDHSHFIEGLTKDCVTLLNIEELVQHDLLQVGAPA